MSVATVADFQPTHYLDVEEQRFLRCLESLRRWANISNGHQVEKRTVGRSDYEGHPFVILELPAELPDRPNPVTASFRVWGRDLSQSGLCFLTAKEIMPVVVQDDTPVARVDEILQPGAELTMGLPGRGGVIIWVMCQVMRFRAVHEGLFDVGVKFLRKTESPRGPVAR